MLLTVTLAPLLGMVFALSAGKSGSGSLWGGLAGGTTALLGLTLLVGGAHGAPRASLLGPG